VRIDFLRTLEPRLLLELSWWRIVYFLVLLLFGLRTRAIRVISSHVLSKKGLVGISRDSLRYCQPQLLQCLEILRDREAYPVLVHCTQGKDRTGLLAVLVGLAIEVPVEAVTADYAMSNEGLRPAREVMLREVEEIGLGEEFLMAPEMLVKEVVGFLEEEWGGVEAYLDAIGFGKGKREELRALLRR
jgi:protein-tyrosine phosphatase